jgi:hypothetical protein
VPAEQRGWLDNRELLPPGEATAEEHKREPERIRCPSRSHLPLPVERELFAEKEILRGQGHSRSDTGVQKPHEINSKRR